MNYCRLCLKHDSTLPYFNSTSIQDKIKTVFSFEITSQPGLPELICRGCVETISNFYDYFCLIRQNQLTLYSQLKDCSVKTIHTNNEKFQPEECHMTAKHAIETDLLKINIRQPSESEQLKDVDLYAKNAFKIIPTKPYVKLIIDDPVEILEQHPVNLSWKIENNVICRHLEMVCDVCHANQVTLRKLRVHLKKCHRRYCYITCCNQKIDNAQLVTDHFKSHSPVIQSKVPPIEKFNERRKDNTCLSATNKLNLNDVDTKTSVGNETLQQKSWKFESNRIYWNLGMKCEINYEAQSTFPILEAHLEKYGNKECYIACCNETFYTEHNISKHLDKHKPIVKSEKITSTNRKIDQFKVFASVLIDFKNELEEYEPLHQDSFQCEYCEQTFINKSNLKAHTNNTHNGEKERILNCDQCDRSFSIKKTLNAHRYKHRLYKCDICDLEMNLASLKKHKKSMHVPREEIACPDCPKVYHDKKKFNIHHKKVHLKPLMKNPPEVQNVPIPEVQNVPNPEVQNVQKNVCDMCPTIIINNKKDLKLHYRLVHSIKFKGKSGKSETVPQKQNVSYE